MAEPHITIRAIHDSGPGNLPPTRVVIHATNPGVGFPAASSPGRAQSTAAYFALAVSGGSAQYVCDVAGETHCVPDDVISWNAPPNPGSIGIEICAEGGSPSAAPLNYSREQWLSPQVWPAVQRAADRTAELCHRFGIPMVRIGPGELRTGAHGICGHVDVSQAWHETDHSDPGPSFPWQEFMSTVTGSTAAPNPSTGTPTSTAKDEPVVDIDIHVKPDGTFRRMITGAEAGRSSAIIGEGWVKWANGWVGGANFHICQLAGGAVMAGGVADVPSAVINKVYTWPLLDGCEAVTIEGWCPPGGEVNAGLIVHPR